MNPEDNIGNFCIEPIAVGSKVTHRMDIPLLNTVFTEHVKSLPCDVATVIEIIHNRCTIRYCDGRKWGTETQHLTNV